MKVFLFLQKENSRLYFYMYMYNYYYNRTYDINRWRTVISGNIN